MKPYYNALCKRYLPQTRSMLTVSAGLAKEYAREFGVDPVLIRNAPSFEKLEPSRRGNRIRIVYHGVAQRRRNLESLIDVVRAIGDGFELHFMLKTRQSRLQELKQHAAGCDRIHFHPPVLSQEIARTINQYDIGVAFFPPVTFNLKHCLPNKFFEYIQGRLGVLVGPTPDMAEIVEREGCGVIARDFSNEALYEALTELSSDKVERMKQRSHEIASTYCWDVESERFRTVISDALEGPR
ncbi:hypothetical protein UC8_06160 [Roseimaritima ulvae]|uniref:Glycosyl transferases group 1 n=2 Tax=Roseimaritima ulvae TaxID=980254 RepID=A0A5B9QHX7_9BACT|nr:hypothetical protein UC8_06160 [Roseimaritima ulvae]